jgi:predicted HAD superfamily Cof-like phosphohydrolase
VDFRGLKMDFVEKVKLFNEIAGTKEEYNTRKVGLYTSLVLEEVSEMVQALGMENTSLFEFLDIYRKAFKAGAYDMNIEKVLEDHAKRVEFVDAAVDIAVVALGGGIAVGADISGACHAVADNNLEKFPIVDGKHTVLKDENGKVMKPASYQSVTLEKFVK